MKIIRWNGNPIRATGLYSGVPIDFYHDDPCDGPSISSTGIRLIETRSPAHYWCRSPYNPQRVAAERKPEWDLGKAVHNLLLGEGSFWAHHVTSPYDDFRTKAAREWRDEMHAAGKVIVTEEMVFQIRGMAKAVAQSDTAPELFDGFVEHSLFWKDWKTGVWLKSRPDVIPTSSNMLVDLKTTDNASTDAVIKSITNYGYDIQAALAVDGMKQVLDREITNFWFVFVEKDPPFAISVVEIDRDWILNARQRTRRGLDMFQRCLTEGEWPAYGPPRTVFMPDWMRQRAETEQKYGLLPSLEATYVQADTGQD